MEIEASENAQISEIHDKNKYEINYTNPIGDTIVDNTRPVIKAAICIRATCIFMVMMKFLIRILIPNRQVV